MRSNKTMKADTAAGGWFSGWRRRPGPTQPDFADFGTAFGLDLSLSQMLLDEMQPTLAPPPPARAGWVRRLVRPRSTG